MVSGSISLPFRGAFHLSLTVLSAIGCQVVFSLGRWTSLIHTGFLVSRATRDHSQKSLPFRLQGFHLLWLSFPTDSAKVRFGNSWGKLPLTLTVSHNPHAATPAELALHGFGLFPLRSPLLRESQLFSFPPGTKMFQFPGYHLYDLMALDQTCCRITCSRLPH